MTRASLAPHDRICAALDVPTLDDAVTLARSLAGHVGLAKVGLELFVAEGPRAVSAIRATGLPVFLDLKLHDIPNTVGHAAKVAGALGVRMLTIHASGGAAMVRAARQGLDDAGAHDTLLLAVTVLTSLGADDLGTQAIAGSVSDHVLRLAELALSNGATGLVCSPLEIEGIRRRFGDSPALVVPGIRPVGSARGDQQRTATPRAAVDAGADWIVVGRPLREGPDAASNADAIAAELSG